MGKTHTETLHQREYADNKHMKRCSPSGPIREMQFKIIMRHRYKPTRKAKIKNNDNSKCQPGCRDTGSLVHCGQKSYSHSGKPIWQFLKN